MFLELQLKTEIANKGTEKIKSNIHMMNVLSKKKRCQHIDVNTAWI